jgi:hypothetical protein
MSAKAAGLEFDDFHNWSIGGANYKDHADCHTVWKSIKEGPITAATLFEMARKNGWQDDSHTGDRNAHRAGQTTRPVSDPIQTEETEPAANAAVLELWERCEPATSEHPYIVAKRGQPDGLRIVRAGDTATIAGQSVAGWLAVPATSLDGDLRTLQLIPPPCTGKKLNMPGASFDDGLFVVGSIEKSSRVFIVEGIGQAWACWSATGHAAVVCFGAGRMLVVAKQIRERFASLPLVLVPDKGMESHAAEVARAVGGLWTELPADKPRNYDANDYATEHGTEDLASTLERTKAPKRRYRVITADELSKTPPMRWLIRGVVPERGLACMYGASASGKSFLALDMCASVASGARWFNLRVKAVPVVYVALEGEQGFRQRIDAWQLHQRRDIPEGLRFVMQPFDLREPDDMAELAAAVTAFGGAGLLVIDTLNRASSGADENSSREMGQVIEAAKRLQAQLGGAVLLIHHSGKDATKGLRGHSSLFAALDAAVEVRRKGNQREWVIAKSKDDGDSAAFPFCLDVVEIGKDEHGDPIKSCAVVPDGYKPNFPTVLPPKSGNQRIVLDTLKELLREADGARPADAPDRLPEGRPVVPVEFAIEACRDRLTTDHKRRTERAKEALTGLQARGLIQMDGNYLWMP